MNALPTPSKAAADWLADAFGDDALHGFLTSLGEPGNRFFQGFKISARNAAKKTVRNRVRRELLRDTEFLLLLLEAPQAPWHDWCLALAALEEQWLVGNWRELVRKEGGQHVAVAMVLDKRPRVARRGGRLLRSSSLWTDSGTLRSESEPAPAWDALARVLAKPQSPVPLPDVKDAAEIRSLEKEKHTLQTELDTARKALNKHKARHKELRDELSAEKASRREEKRTLRRELTAARSGLENLKGGLSETIQSRVDAFKAEALGLTDSLQAIRETFGNGKGDLHERALTMLAEHRRVNERYGTLSQVRAEIDELEATEKQLQGCVAESVVVLPEMRSLMNDVRQRITFLRGLLPEAGAAEAPTDRLRAALLATLKGAPCEGKSDLANARLAAVEEALGVPLVTELLGQAASNDLRRELRVRRELLRAREDTQAGTPGPEPRLPESHRGPREIWDVGLELGRLSVPSGVWVFIDGYNVIKGAPALATIEEIRGLAPARDELCRLCSRRNRLFTHVEIVFDGTESVHERHDLEGITIAFAARRQESQNADVYIEERMRAVREQATSLWLVTGDYGLRTLVWDICDAFIGSIDFHRFIAEKPNETALEGG